jgi:hypothetical protein
MREPLFTVSNHHTPSCGEPSAVDRDAAGTCVGHFANESGEQAVSTYDHGTGEATIRMGDADCHDTYRVEEGRAQRFLLATHDSRPRLGAHLASQGHGALHVGEEHGHLLPLAFQRRPGLPDLVGQVPARGGGRRGLVRRRRRRGRR